MKRNKNYKSVGQYFVMGPAAVAARVEDLDDARNIHRKSFGDKTIILECLSAIGLGKVTPRVRRLLRILAKRTLSEINNEMAAFRSLLGSRRRPWEVS